MSFKNSSKSAWQAIKRFFSETVDDKYSVTPTQAIAVGNLCGAVNGMPIVPVVPPAPIPVVEPDHYMIVGGGHKVKGTKEAIGYVDSMVTQQVLSDDIIFELTADKEELKQKLEKATMNIEKLYETLSNSRKILVETLNGHSVLEARIAKYVDWYEKHRDPRLTPKQDFYTYQMCKTVCELEARMLELQAEHAAQQAAPQA